MAQYDLYVNGNGYLIDVQSDLLDRMSTRIVIPLLPKGGAPQPARRLNPTFEIRGEIHVLVPQFMAAITLGELGPAIANLSAQHDDIRAALDMVFIGF